MNRSNQGWSTRNKTRLVKKLKEKENSKNKANALSSVESTAAVKFNCEHSLTNQFFTNQTL